MVHKDVSIHLVVKSRNNETPGYQSVVFERPVNFEFDSGDWIDIAMKGLDHNGGKTYSLASSPTEQNLRITFREGLSPLKKTLASAKPGDALTITQYGNDYGFQLRANRASVLIAGGVGIAPFRSMLKEMFDQNSKNHVHLIYLNQTADFLFQDELDTWARTLQNLRIDYIPTKELNRKKREKLLTTLINNPNQQFYIAGPTGMVTSTSKLLTSINVHERDIKIDSFGGY